MKIVWTVWTTNADMETLLVGVATNRKKAYKMKAKIEEELENAFEVLILETETDKLNINNTDILF